MAAVNFGAIPEDLQGLPRWLLWRPEERKGNGDN